MKIILHLGAHKTASTYIQDRLAASRDALAAQKIALAVPSEIRASIAEARAGLARLRPRKLLANALAERVDLALSQGAKRLVISEENVLGLMNPLLTDVPFYEKAAARLREVLPVFAGHDLTLALAVRNYGAFYASVWGFMLRERYAPFDEDLKTLLLARQREWPDLVTHLCQTAPGIPIVLWKYEGFGTLEPDVFASLVGGAAVGAITPSHYRPLLGPSRKAIKRLETIAQSEPLTPEVVNRVLRVQSKAKGLARYDPWTEVERKSLTRRYRADVDIIRAMDQVVPLLKDDETVPGAAIPRI